MLLPPPPQPPDAAAAHDDNDTLRSSGQNIQTHSIKQNGVACDKALYVRLSVRLSVRPPVPQSLISIGPHVVNAGNFLCK